MIGLALAAAAALGTEHAACRADEPGPALVVEVVGLKDRTGGLRLELYPADEADFLADDTALLAAGKPFRRVDASIPASGPVELCIRAPGAGAYAAVVLHDRNGDRKFTPFSDGAGVPGARVLGLSRPSVSRARVEIGSGVDHVQVIMNYWSGLGFRPAKAASGLAKERPTS